MKDYSKTIMYKIVGSGMTYYGHTTTTLEKRKSNHRSKAKSVTLKKKTCKSKLIVDAGDWEMIEIEKYPCANVKEARARERYWIENHECVNKNIPGRTYKEWTDDNKSRMTDYYKAYYETNRTKIAECHKAYYETNRTKIAEHQKAYYEANKAEIAEYQKAYNEAHKAERAEYQKAYNEAHQAERAAYREAHKVEKAEYLKAYSQWNKSWDGLNKINI